MYQDLQYTESLSVFSVSCDIATRSGLRGVGYAEVVREEGGDGTNLSILVADGSQSRAEGRLGTSSLEPEDDIHTKFEK
jgi:hypothetical protein